MATGTDRNDTLTATARGELLKGRGGHDVLTSLFNRTKLFGEAGNDKLSVDLQRTEETSPVTLFAGLSGGAGKDTLTLKFSGEAPNVTMEADLDGGDGDDILKADVGGYGYGWAYSDLKLSGGAGNDTIDVSVAVYGYDSQPTTEESAQSVTTIDGGNGNDTIRASADTDGGTKVSATIRVFGGGGNDKIYASNGEGIGRAGMDIYSTNEIDGGDGRDYIEVRANVNANGGYYAKNVVSGGSGNDTIKAVATASSNDSGPKAENIVDGGDGDDSIEVATAAAYGTVTLRAKVDGGDGDDKIVSNASGTGYSTDAKLKIDGGVGNDYIKSTIEFDSAGYFRANKISHALYGFDGNDTLISKIKGPGSWGLDGLGTSSVNRLEGGDGTDVLEASTDVGRSLLDGGRGNDILKVDGGTRNLLTGGGGADRLFAGSGTDRMGGGSGVDDYVFDVTIDQSKDLLVDFDFDADRLCFIGLNDGGARGLADEIDAISTIVDEGAGLDVILRFDSGSAVVFEGCGVGTGFMGEPLIDSIADLVDDALSQLRAEPV